MAHYFNNISAIIILITVWNYAACEIYIDTNIHDILDSHLMPIDVFATCAKCRHKNQFTMNLKAVLLILTYHR